MQYHISQGPVVETLLGWSTRPYCQMTRMPPLEGPVFTSTELRRHDTTTPTQKADVHMCRVVDRVQGSSEPGLGTADEGGVLAGRLQYAGCFTPSANVSTDSMSGV